MALDRATPIDGPRGSSALLRLEAPEALRDLHDDGHRCDSDATLIVACAQPRSP